jgi:cytochrome c oxidase assembly factor 2
MTSSLFATTVIASFFVVALPHVLPCPAPRVVYADGQMPDGPAKRRRRKRPETTETADRIVQFPTTSENDGDDDSAAKAASSKRECPVPKPSGMLGELLGFKKSTSGDSDPRRSDR